MKLATTIIGKATEDIIQKGRKIASFLLDTGEIDLENSYYALQSAQLLAGSFMDYAMPRADTLPLLATALSEIPAPLNRLDVRSGGEGGTTAVVINAVVDALAELGVRHIELPATPERVWRAIRAGDAAAVR